MTREGAEKVREALKVILEQCRQLTRAKTVRVFPNIPQQDVIRVIAVMICLSVFLTIDFRRWFNDSQ